MTNTFVTVRPHRDGDATTFHVHGSGLIINEFGIARTVTTAVKESLTTPGSG